MNEKVEPALSAERWQSVKADHAAAAAMALMAGGDFPEWARIVAIANDALPPDDRGKITREKIQGLRDSLSSDNNFADQTDVWAFLDALESYLPPETL